MKLKEIHRTSTFAWSPTPSLPLLATGSVAGALDESFSNESQLEIWAPDFLDKFEYDLGQEGQHGPKGVIKDSARFNRLTWGYVDASRPRGIVAAGMENGELALWDPAKILAGASQSESLILRNTTHTGPVRGLDFNPIQTNLLSSGGINGEVYIWDLKDPSKPYSPTPGARSTKLDEITSVAWNQQVQYVLAGASSTGYTVVWDLRGKREVVALAYGGGSGTLAGQAGTGSGLAVGGRRGMSDIAWHPDNATRLVTASEDDSSPIIMVWDLRNARAPEKILTGHEKGVLSLSWCKQDADLLLSCGKDNRALCWNPQTSEIIGELPSADNWAFQVDWCPRNPDLLATAFFDGTIGIHSIQSTNDSANGGAPAVPPKADGADIFDVPGFSRTTQGGTLSLKQPPKWLRRPTSASFGFGGKLVSVSNLPSVHGKNQSSVVHLRQVVTETDLVERASRLQAAIDGKTLNTFAEERSQGQVDAKEGTAGWKALLSLFKADSRDELVTLLGFSKSEIAIRVAEAIEHLKTSSTLKEEETEVTEATPREPVVSFVEPEQSDIPSENSDGERDDATSTVEKTPSEISTSAASDATSGTHLATDGESTTTVPSLFGDDNIPGTPQIDAAGDFFSTMGIGNDSDGNSRQVQVPHHNYGIDSSVAATVGSRSSSVASGNTKSNHFRIYPPEESETDRLVTKALVLGDFESAVSLCLSSDRFADAILLAAKGGAELLQRTQKAYFERQTTSLPYLRLFQSIVTNDLADIVQNADLQEWQEIFVVLCTFASQEEFSSLAEQLGTRLEFQFTVSKSSENPATVAKADDYRKNATLTYLAAGRLERLVSIWIDELLEEEKDLISEQKHLDGSRYTAHAHALQTFIEKVTVFRSAIKYVDADLSQTSNANTYKLSGLYDRYFEYADLLATQGLVKEAVAFLNLTPSDYKGSSAVDLSIHRDRLLKAAAATIALAPRSSSLPEATRTIPVSSSSYAQYATQPQQPVAPVYQAPSQTASYGQPSYTPYSPAGSSTAGQPSHIASQAPVTQQSAYPTAGYNSYNSQASLTQPPHLRNQNQPAAAPSLAPPPKRQENGGWNDAPLMNTTRGPGALNLAKPPAITSPFPNAAPSPGFGAPPASPFMNSGQPPSSLPPPPRPGSRAAPPPPPPQGRMQAPPQPNPGMYPPQTRPPSGPPGPMVVPARLMSPPDQPARQPTPGQYGPSLSRGHVSQTPPPYVRPTPPPGPPHGHTQPQGLYTQSTPPHGQPGNPSPYTSPLMQQQQQPQQQQSGPYGPPPSSQRPGPAQPPHNAGPAPPPGGPVRSNSAAPSRAPKGPPPPKYPPGDRSHIPDSARPAYDIISEQLNRLKQTTPPSQKRLVDDLERRISPLFDALNCETLSTPVVDQLLVLTRAMAAHDRQASLAIHVDLLTRGSQTDDIGLWMSGVKQLIMRM